jgi:hypothetical protein
VLPKARKLLVTGLQKFARRYAEATITLLWSMEASFQELTILTGPSCALRSFYIIPNLSELGRETVLFTDRTVGGSNDGFDLGLNHFIHRI